MRGSIYLLAPLDALGQAAKPQAGLLQDSATYRCSYEYFLFQSIATGCDSCRINLTYINTRLTYPCNNCAHLTSGPPHSNRTPASARRVLPQLHTHRAFYARTTISTMRDLRKQALESHKTMSRKARSKIASGASSLAGSRTASRNGSRAPSDDGDDGYLSDETAWR